MKAAAAVEARIRRARVQLVLAHPFVGTLALHLDPTPVEADWCLTFSTDGRRFYYRPDYVASIGDPELAFCLAHAVLHAALDHLARRGERESARWDRATDLAVNALLLAPRERGGEAMTAPAGAVYDPRFLDLAAEEIYRRLPPGSRRGRRFDAHLQGSPSASGSGSDPGEGPRPAETWTGPAPAAHADPDAWRRRLVQAATAARIRGTLPAGLARSIENLLEPRLPWPELLARFVHRTARYDYRPIPPNRRFLYQGVYLPSVGGQHLELVVAIDTSGSISPALLDRFAAELDGILLSVGSYRIEILACDARIGLTATVESPDPFPRRTLPGGGGTDFRPVFDRIESEGWNPDALVYLTDGEGDYPRAAPAYPVLWLVHGDKVPPFGERVALDLES